MSLTIFINRAPIGDDGEVLATSDTAQPDWPFLGGYSYDPATGFLAVIDAVPAADDPTVNGLRMTPEGNLYIWSFEGDGDPGDVVYASGGLPCTDNGRLIVTSELPPVLWCGGWPRASNGWVCMTEGVVPPPDCESPTTILTHVWAGDDTGNFSQNDTSGGGAGDFAKSFQSFSFDDGAMVTDLHWTGGYISRPPENTNFATAWLIEFWNDNAGQPGTLAQTAVFTPALANETFVSNTGSVEVYTYSVDILPWFLADEGVTYWVSVQPTLIFPPGWLWLSNGAGGSWSVFEGDGAANAYNFAMAITGCVGTAPPATNRYLVESGSGNYLEEVADYYIQE